MITNCSTKTVTEVDQDVIIISCFADMNENGSTTPKLFKADLLSDSKQINEVDGKEGELLLTYEGSSVGHVNSDGELILELEGDDVDKYSINERGELIYNG